MRQVCIRSIVQCVRWVFNLLYSASGEYLIYFTARPASFRSIVQCVRWVCNLLYSMPGEYLINCTARPVGIRSIVQCVRWVCNLLYSVAGEYFIYCTMRPVSIRFMKIEWIAISEILLYDDVSCYFNRVLCVWKWKIYSNDVYSFKGKMDIYIESLEIFDL